MANDSRIAFNKSFVKCHVTDLYVTYIVLYGSVTVRLQQQSLGNVQVTMLACAHQRC